MRPIREESVNFDTTENLYIEGDNLEALKLLRETYLGKIKMIYIDPPYNTGSDFIYNDDFSQSEEEYKEISGNYDEDGNRLFKNTDSNGRFHTDWLNMIYPRLKLARDLLTDDGVIFISIDDNEQANLKKLCDEIFGIANYMECFVWDKKNSAKGVPPKSMIVNIHEYILCYAKSNISKLTGELRTKETFSNPDNDFRGDWRMSNIKSTVENYKNKFTITDPKTKISYTNFWAFSEETLKKMINEDRIIFPNNPDGLPKQKEFFNEFKNPYIPLKSHLGLFDSQSTSEKKIEKMMELKLFLYRKPLDLMKYIIKYALSNDITILDFFSGSATTAHAVMELNAEDSGNRKYIMVQLPEKTVENSDAYKEGYKNICEIGKERIRRASKKLKEENPNSNFDDGFRVLRIDSSNMKDVYYKPEEFTQENLKMFESNIKEDRSGEDLLFQVMLDLGIELSNKIEEKFIQNNKIYDVGENFLIACFDENITEEVVTEIAKLKPFFAIFKEGNNLTDNTLINFEEIFKTYSPDTKRRVL